MKNIFKVIYFLIITLTLVACTATTQTTSYSSSEVAKPVDVKSNTVLLIDCSKMNEYEQTAVAAFQGIVNRTGPKIYLYTGAQCYLNTLKDNPAIDPSAFPDGTLDKYPCVEDYMIAKIPQLYGLTMKKVDFNTAIETYKYLFAGLIEYDAVVTTNGVSTDGPARTSAAMTAAGVYSCIPVTPMVKNKYKALQDMKVQINMQNKFENKYEAQQWAVDNILKYTSKDFAASYWVENGTFQSDYAIMNKAFCFELDFVSQTNMSHADPAEAKKYNPLDEQLTTSIFAHLKPLGFIWGWGEGGENAIASRVAEAGLTDICANMANGSFYAQLKPKQTTFKQSHVDPTTVKVQNKFYFSFMVNEGDTYKALATLYNNGSWINSARGQFPIAWGVDPLTTTLFPALTSFYYGTKTSNDYFFNAAAGYGYIHPAFLKPDVRTQYADNVKNMSSITDTNLIDIWWFSMTDKNGKDIKWDWFKQMGMQGLTQWDNANTTTYEPGVPVIRSGLYYPFQYVSGATDEIKAQKIANAMIAARKAQPQDKPFCSVFYGGYPYQFKMVYDLLPKDEFEDVPLDTLFTIANKAKSEITGITANIDLTKDNSLDFDPTQQGN